MKWMCNLACNDEFFRGGGTFRQLLLFLEFGRTTCHMGPLLN